MLASRVSTYMGERAKVLVMWTSHKYQQEGAKHGVDYAED